ncbi:MAG: FAD-dependent oxidoreductase [Bacteroidota bacterium]
MKPPVHILGAGVIGMTTGIVLQEAGYDVTITAKSFSPNTTSDKAAAIWLPFEANPRDKVLKWSAETYQQFVDLSSREDTGVSMVDFILLEYDSDGEFPWWTSILPNSAVQRLESTNVPSDYAYGLSAEVPFIETPIYMKYLHKRFYDNGGHLVSAEIKNLEAWRDAETLNINCTGLGSKTLLGDQDLFPIQGHIVRVRASESLPYISDEDSKNALAYIFPRKEDIIFGGTAVYHENSLTPTKSVIDDVMRRCKNMLDKDVSLEIIDTYIGLRPGRKSVRVEFDSSLQVIHNYGHGGSGFTISWGCALEVLKLARELH